MIKRSRFILLLAALFLIAPDAGALTLYTWVTNPGLPPIILAVPAEMTPEQAAAAYLGATFGDPRMGDVFDASVPRPEIDHLQPFAPPADEKPALFVSNAGYDLQAGASRPRNFRNLVVRQGETLYTLPPSAAAHLNAADEATFQRLLNETFALQIFPGGADVDPANYGEPARGARDFNSLQDVRDLARLRSALQSKKVYVLAICRSAQLTAVALGMKLVQDIPTEIADHEKHERSTHEIQLRDVPGNLLVEIAGGLTLDAFSYHHQAAIFAPGRGAQLAASARDGIAEALLLEGDAGIAVQFHPELTYRGQLRQKFFTVVARAKNQKVARFCENVFAP